MSQYDERLATMMWHELKHVYPWLAPPDERTEEERQQQAERDIVDLFGEQDKKEETPCLSRD